MVEKLTANVIKNIQQIKTNQLLQLILKPKAENWLNDLELQFLKLSTFLTIGIFQKYYVNTKMRWDELPAHLLSRVRADSAMKLDVPKTAPISKYHNKTTEVDGILFDSQKEAEYYTNLLWLKRSGAVTDIKLQPEFVLQPAYEREGKR